MGTTIYSNILWKDYGKNMDDLEIADVTFKRPTDDPDIQVKVESVIEYPQDSTIQNVLNKIRIRADAGIIKYNTSMIGNRGDLFYWLDHVQQELMDATNYIERIIQELERIKEDDLRKLQALDPKKVRFAGVTRLLRKWKI